VCVCVAGFQSFNPLYLSYGSVICFILFYFLRCRNVSTFFCSFLFFMLREPLKFFFIPNPPWMDLGNTGVPNNLPNLILFSSCFTITMILVYLVGLSDMWFIGRYHQNIVVSCSRILSITTWYAVIYLWLLRFAWYTISYLYSHHRNKLHHFQSWHLKRAMVVA